MSSYDFNRDLDKYLNQRRREDGAVQEVEVIDEPKDDIIDVAEQMDELDAQDEVMEQRESVIIGFFRKIGLVGENEVEEDIDPQVEVVETTEPVLDEDIKMVLKMSYTWLSYLPRNKFERFKESEEFEIYKDVLQKYGLVK